MNTKTIILHIGFPKTGTSALQWFLHTNRESLSRQGVCYPVTGQVEDHAHHKLALSLKENVYGSWEEAQRVRLFEELAAEIDASDAHTIVLSSEILVDCPVSIRESREFGNILKGRPVRVICFLRRQAGFMESLYRQLIWDPLERLADGPDVFVKRYAWVGDYHVVLSKWADCFGKQTIEPVVYEQALNAEGCIIWFCRLVGIDVAILGSRDFDVVKNAFTLGALGTEIMRITNAYNDLSIEQRHELADSTARFAASVDHLPLPKKMLSPDLVSQVDAMYLESNRRLADEFVHQPLDGCWFREMRWCEPHVG